MVFIIIIIMIGFSFKARNWRINRKKLLMTASSWTLTGDVFSCVASTQKNCSGNVKTVHVLIDSYVTIRQVVLTTLTSIS